MNCILNSKQVEKLVGEINSSRDDENKLSLGQVKSLISIWQDAHNKNLDEFPSSKAMEEIKSIADEVDDIFKDSEDLRNTGSQLDYLKYLYTVFSNSQVKDIQYHATNKDFDEFQRQNGETLYHVGTKQASEELSDKFEGPTNTKRVLINAEEIINIEDFSASTESFVEFLRALKDKEEITESIQESFRNRFKEIEYSSNKNEEVEKIIADLQELLSKKYPNKSVVISYTNTVENKGSISYGAFSSDQTLILGSKRDIDKFSKYMSKNSGSNMLFRKKTIEVGNTTLTLRDRKKIYEVYDPKTRKARATYVGRLFINNLNHKIEQRRKELEAQIKLAKAPEDKRVFNEELRNLSEVSELNRVGAEEIFEDIKSQLGIYTNVNLEEHMEKKVRQLKKVMSNWKSKYGSEEALLEKVKEVEGKKIIEYGKVYNNFEALAEESLGFISKQLGVEITRDSRTAHAQTSETMLEETTDEQGNTIEESKEEKGKDDWVTGFRQKSAYSSLSNKVRRVLNTIPRYDSEGIRLRDDLGQPIYLDGEYAYVVLASVLNDMVTSKDMLPLLQKAAKTKPWIKDIIGAIENDEVFKAQLYNNLRLDFTNYWIQKTSTNKDGSKKYSSISINTSESTRYLLDTWRNNQSQGLTLTEKSIYNSNGNIDKNSKEHAQKLKSELSKIATRLRSKQKSVEAQIEILNEENKEGKKENWETIETSFKAIGIDMDPNLLKLALEQEAEVYKGSDNKDSKPINAITSLDNVVTILTEIGGKRHGDYIGKDLINSFSGPYKSIAEVLVTATGRFMESSVRENGKSYYSRTTPSYMGKLVKQLKLKDDAAAKKFLDEQFGSVAFFKLPKSNESPDGRWLSDWLGKLCTNEKYDNKKGLTYRDALAHKVVLNQDKLDYKDWSALQDVVAALIEYEANSDSDRLAWYQVPIQSDAPSAEYIRFVKYKDETEVDSDGRKLTFKESILNKLKDVVLQEYNRIILVKNRQQAIAEGKVKPITNFDMVVDEDGNVEKIGGAEFKFFPALNTFKVPVNLTISTSGTVIEANTPFKDALNRILEADGNADAFIKNCLDIVMEESFEKAYDEWQKMGLFETVSQDSDKFKYIKGSRVNHSKLIDALNSAYEIVDNLSIEGNSQEEINRSAKLKKSLLEDIKGLKEDLSEGRRIYDRATNRLLNKIKAQLENDIRAKKEKGIDTKEERKVYDDLELENEAKEYLREFFYNNALATSQIIQLTTTDLAFYKDLTDFQKRYKETHAPSSRLDTSATYGGKKVGREFERTIFIADEVIKSAKLGDIEEILKKRGMSDVDRDYILSQYRNINVTDAQAYRSLSSYRAVKVMVGQWNDQLEQAYNHFQEGTWDIADFSALFQTIKPYLYTQVVKDSGVDGEKIKVPMQNKNSEFLLLAMYNLMSGELGKSGRLKAINSFMEKHNIDVVQFESTVKVGKQGVIDLSGLTTEAEVTKALEDATGVGHGPGLENKDVVHTVSYEDYGIQTGTPEHIVDVTQLIGTQITKLIGADMAEDAVFSMPALDRAIKGLANNKDLKDEILPGIGMSPTDIKKQGGLTKKQWYDLYQSLLTENIIQDYVGDEGVEKLFSSNESVAKILRQDIESNPRYGRELLEACSLDENGEFRLPLHDPVHSYRIQSLLTSIIKSRITKQRIKGGSLYQVTSYGLTDDLHIVYEGEGENKRIKYFECYMPAYSREFFEPFMEEGSHVLDPSDLPEDLRKIVGYRVPTEDKYSMIPLYIKGFLPQQNGSAIMMPAEITSTTGSDFDIDKLFIMLPEFRTIKYNMDAAKKAYNKEHQALSDDEFDRILDTLFGEDSEQIDSTEVSFKKWFKENKEQYKLDKPEFKKINYDFTRSPQDQKNGRAARNNLIIDLMWGVLTNPDTASKILKGGTPTEHIRTGRIMSIIESSNLKELEELLDVKGRDAVVEELLDMSLERAETLAKQLGDRLDPLSQTTHTIFHQRNMVGNKMIGIYAIHNAQHALLQQAKNKKESNSKESNSKESDNGIYLTRQFEFNGKTLYRLDNITNEEGEFISNNNAGFLSMAVDNGKDPLLSAFNQNTFTSNVTMLLSRMGARPMEIALFLQQPIIKEMVLAYQNNTYGEYASDTTIIENIVNKYKEAAGLNSNLFATSDAAKHYYKVESMMGNLLSDKNSKDFNVAQANIGQLFLELSKYANALSEFVNATRPDNVNNAAGPEIADSIDHYEKYVSMYQDYKDKIEDGKKPPIMGIDLFELNIDTSNLEKARKKILSSPIPYLQAHFTFGLESNRKLLGDYFPHFNKNIQDVVASVTGYTKYGKLNSEDRSKLYEDLTNYMLSDIPFMQNDEVLVGDKRELRGLDKVRSYYINEFVDDFVKILEENPELYNIEFIKNLQVNNKSKSGVKTIELNNTGSMSPKMKAQYTNDWESLLYMDPNSIGPKLALALFKYSYFRSGLGFSPNSFGHLAPISLREAIPRYREALNSMMNKDIDYSKFVKQFILNNRDNYRLVRNSDSLPSGLFITKEGNKTSVNEQVFLEVNDSTEKEYSQIIDRTSTLVLDGQPIKLFYPALMIKRTIGGNDYFYELVSDPNDPDENGTARYQLVTPLGYPNGFKEYSFGKNAEEVETSIGKNKPILDITEDNTPLIKKIHREEKNSWIDNTTSVSNQAGISPQGVLSKATEIVTGNKKKINTSIVSDEELSGYTKIGSFEGSNSTFTELQPNENYQDGADQIIC